MSKTIEQLRAEAALIEDAVRQGENTQVRVGGLFQDIIDFIAQIPITETVLGPLLKALNNSELINPGDGQTLVFSLMKESWTFSDALTQLQIKLGQISSTVASNYEAFLKVKDLLQAEIDSIDERVRNYKTEYDQSQLEYFTWKSQTDTSISQYAAAIDRNTKKIVSISGRVDTAFDQLDFVTNDLEAADKAIGKLFDLTGMELSDEPSASWLYKNKDGIYGAAATFDENGNIKQYSKLSVTINGIESKAENALGQVSTIKQTVDTIQAAVGTSQREIDTLNDYINGTAGNPGLLSRLGIAENKITADEKELSRHASTLVVHDNAIAAVSAKFNPDGSLANTSGLVVSSDFSELFAEAYDDTGAVTTMTKLRADLNGVSQEVSNAKGQISQITQKVGEINATVYDSKTGIGALNVKADNVQMTLTNVKGDVEALMGLDIVEGDELVDRITRANIKADVFDFRFTKQWVVSANGITVLKLDPNGNLEIKGQLTENATFGVKEPIKVDGDGNIIRYDKYDNTWIPLFARRNVRILTVTYSGQSFTLTSSDDFVLVNPNSTSYVANVTLPSNVDSYGKVLTIKQCGGKSVLKVGKSGDRISTDHATTQQDLNDYDRAELVYYSGTWFWNAMSI